MPHICFFVIQEVIMFRIIFILSNFFFQDFVENKMELNAPEQRPYKHNKAFYPPLIEIQNMIQQTQAALNSGVVAPLPAVSIVHI